MSFERGAKLRERLVEVGSYVGWHTCPTGHEVCLDEIEALGTWLSALLKG